MAHTSRTMVANLTAKQAEILGSLAAAEVDGPGEWSVRDLAANIATNGEVRGWVGIDPEGMTQTLKHLLLRGLVERREATEAELGYRRPRWYWRITQDGWEALMASYDQRGL